MTKSRFGKVSRYMIGAAALLASTAPANAALMFNLTYIAGTSVQAQNAFAAAAARWSAAFTDNITVNLTVGTKALGAGILGSTGSSAAGYSYSAFRAALAGDATSADDATAVANLGAGSSFNMLLNYTNNNPNGVGSATAYLDNDGDANNTTVRINSANARAMGIAGASTGTTVGDCTSACDGSVAFSTAFTFDYDPSDGITAGAYDFVGIATHEIGHALGFVSGVDILDINSPNQGAFFNDNQFTFVTPLDMFRYSAASCAQAGGPVIDWTAGASAKNFTIDKCSSIGPGFSTGTVHGDGRQASHWKDNLGLGIMDPTAGTGELLAISENDLRAFDVIGWTRATAGVPEPTTWAMMIAGFGVIGAAARRRRTKVVYAV